MTFPSTNTNTNASAVTNTNTNTRTNNSNSFYFQMTAIIITDSHIWIFVEIRQIWKITITIIIIIIVITMTLTQQLQSSETVLVVQGLLGFLQISVQALWGSCKVRAGFGNRVLGLWVQRFRVWYLSVCRRSTIICCVPFGCECAACSMQLRWTSSSEQPMIRSGGLCMWDLCL